MKLKNILLVVKNIEHSKQFYRDIFHLSIVLDREENVIMTEGLVLQEEKIWKQCIENKIEKRNHSFELYFEENDLESFMDRLEQLYPEVEYVSKMMSDEWGKKMIRFYDPDGHLIEVGTPG